MHSHSRDSRDSSQSSSNSLNSQGLVIKKKELIKLITILLMAFFAATNIILDEIYQQNSAKIIKNIGIAVRFVFIATAIAWWQYSDIRVQEKKNLPTTERVNNSPLQQRVLLYIAKALISTTVLVLIVTTNNMLAKYAKIALAIDIALVLSMIAIVFIALSEFLINDKINAIINPRGRSLDDKTFSRSATSTWVNSNNHECTQIVTMHKAHSEPNLCTVIEYPTEYNSALFTTCFNRMLQKSRYLHTSEYSGTPNTTLKRVHTTDQQEERSVKSTSTGNIQTQPRDTTEYADIHNSIP